MAKESQYVRAANELPEGVEAMRVAFDSGTVLLRDVAQAQCGQFGVVWDDRVGHGRASAHAYRAVVGNVMRSGRFVVDEARAFEEVELRHDQAHTPHSHQAEAVEAWLQGGRRGVVVLPTGAGKSYVAELIMASVARSTLVIAPTLDLVDQWIRRLQQAFGIEVGALGGGRHDVLPVTVSTYDSAAIHMERLGNRFGLVVFDEVHHLPGDLYRLAAEHTLAPFRLGLTATPEREDGRHRVNDELVGPVLYRQGIRDLAGDVLSEYTTESVEVPMTPADREEYDAARAQYRGFVDSQGIRMGGDGWRRFLAATSRSEEGRAALAAYHRQKRLALAHSNKLEALADILTDHWEDRTIVFANDNETVYAISERFLCPTITHQTPLAERTEVLSRFADGTYRVVVTSKVLNEGVDVPAASVAVVLSGTGSVREHVQRLGRILRRAEGKQAILYELVTADSVETHTSNRRRDHDAYR